MRKYRKQLKNAHLKKIRPLWLRLISGLFKAAMLLVGLVLFLLVGGWMLLQIPAVQNYTIHQVANFLSKELGTKVEVKAVNIDFFDRVILEGLYVEDIKGDTLIFADKIQADITFFSIFDKKLALDGISLTNPTFHYKRLNGEKDFNMEFIIRYFAGKDKADKPKTESAPFILSAKRINLDNAKFLMIDEPTRTQLNVTVRKARAMVRSFDPDNLRLSVRSVSLEKPVVQLVKLPRQATIPSTQVSHSNNSPSKEPKLWDIIVDQLQIDRGAFQLDEQESSPKNFARSIDFKHLNTQDINLQVDSFKMYRETFAGKVRQLQVKEKSGFEISSLQSDVLLRRGYLRVADLEMQTPKSHIRDSLVFRFKDYTDFERFENNVFMDANIRDSKVCLSDIMAFAPELNNNSFFSHNRDQVLQVDGQVNGLVNDLRGKNLKLQMLGKTTFDGDITLKDITTKGKQFMVLNCNQLSSNVNDLAKILPDVILPAMIQKVGNFSFKGSYSGYLQGTFLSKGILDSDLGQVEVDMTMDTKHKPSDIPFNSKIRINDFNLGKLLGNPDFGIASVTLDAEGKGLNAESITGVINEGWVRKFMFKGYQYENIKLDGRVNKRLFDGHISSTDPNANLDFQGIVDFNSKSPVFKFSTNIRNLDLKKLNIIDKDYKLSANAIVDFVGIDPDKMEGRALIRDIRLLRNQQRVSLDSIRLISTYTPAGKSIQLASNHVQAAVNGQFTPTKVVEALLVFAQTNYSGFTDRLGIKRSPYLIIDTIANVSSLPPIYIPRSLLPDHDFNFYASVDRLDFLNDFIGEDVKELSNGQLNGFFNSKDNNFGLTASLAKLELKNNHLDSIGVEAKVDGKRLNVNAKAAALHLSDSLILRQLALDAGISRDTLYFEAGIASPNPKISALALAGEMHFEDDLLALELYSAKNKEFFTIYGKNWFIAPNSSIKFKKDYLYVRDFVVTDGIQQLRMESFGTKGLKATVKDIDLEWVNSFVPTDKFAFKGFLRGNVRAHNVFTLDSLYTDLAVDSIFINDDNWGLVEISAHSFDKNSVIHFDHVKVSGMRGTVLADGHYNLPKAKNPMPGEPPNYLDVNGVINNVSPEWLEYILQGEISDVQGGITGKIKVKGPPQNLEIKGDAYLQNAAATMKLLNTRYFVDKLAFDIDYKGFHIKGKEADRVLKDIEGNTAVIEGSIWHKRFKDFGANLYIITPKLQVLNTVKQEGSVFYGKAYAKALANFDGPFNNMELYINAETLPGTNVDIPIGGTSNVDPSGLITFVNKKTSTKQGGKKVKLNGVTLTMDLTLTPDAQVRLIMDEQAGDIISGRGNGDLTINFVSNTSDFKMYGLYTVQKGEYLFTFQNLINKPFTVAEGGTIRWSGDALNAQINLDAFYKGLRATPYNLIQDLLKLNDDGTLEDEAKTPTDVDLSLKLTGDLMQPDISFNIALNNISAQLKSVVESRLKQLREDKNALNRQVAALILFKTFFPEQGGNAGAAAIPGSINTLTEMLTSQLSMYLSDLLTGAVAESGVFSDFDVNIGVQLVDQSSSATNPDQLFNQRGQVNLGLSPSFIDGKLILKVGTMIDIGNQSTTNTNAVPIGGDFLVEYKINSSGSLRVRAYYRNESNFFGRVNRYGVGISVKKEFDSVGEIFGFLKKKGKR